jgi:hypothetical protein
MNSKQCYAAGVLAFLALGYSSSLYLMLTSSPDAPESKGDTYIMEYNCTDTTGGSYDTHCPEAHAVGVTGGYSTKGSCDEFAYRWPNITWIDELCISSCEALCGEEGPATATFYFGMLMLMITGVFTCMSWPMFSNILEEDLNNTLCDRYNRASCFASFFNRIPEGHQKIEISDVDDSVNNPVQRKALELI